MSLEGQSVTKAHKNCPQPCTADTMHGLSHMTLPSAVSKHIAVERQGESAGGVKPCRLHS